MKIGLFAAFALFVQVPVAPAAQAQTPAGPSFDCARAKGVVEQAICRDPALAEADREMARLFAASRISAFGTGPSNMLPGQRAWLKDREDCVAFARNVYKSREDCVARHYAIRNEELAIAALFAEPELALATLRKTDPEMAPLYEAVLIYASLPEADPMPARQRARLIELLEPQFEQLRSEKMRSYGRDILKGSGIERAIDAIKSEEAFTDALPVLATYVDGQSIPMTMPCAALVRRPGLWTATLARFGSGLDSGIPMADCKTALPPLPKLDALIDQISAGWPACEGSIRFSAYRSFSAMIADARLGSTVEPGYRSGPGKRTTRRLTGVNPDAVANAIFELTAHYQKYRHVDLTAARAAARDAVIAILDSGHECGEGED